MLEERKQHCEFVTNEYIYEIHTYNQGVYELPLTIIPVTHAMQNSQQFHLIELFR